MLHKLIFDTTDADTIADSHSVGAYIRSSDGTLITHTDVSGKKALDVRVAEGINVEVDLTFAEDSVDVSGSIVALDAATLAALEDITVSATDFDIRDLAFATDSVDVSGSSVSISGDVNVTQGTDPWIVSATDLDIRNLAFATDTVDVSGSSVSVSGDVNVTQGTDPWVVSATDLDIRDLAFATDSVDVSGSSVSISGDVNVTQGTDPWVVSATDLDIRDLSFATDTVDVSGSAVSISGTVTTSDAALADTAIATASNALGTDDTAEDLVASPLAGRKYLWVYNKGNREAYIGASGVTTASGFPIPPGSMLPMRAGAAIDIEWVAASATGSDMRTMELS